MKKPEVKTPDRFVHPLTDRYASEEMSAIFSARFKFETWRRLWLWLAEEERRLGLPISEEALIQMRAALTQIDFEAAEREEEKSRHDVMAHVRVFGEAAPAAPTAATAVAVTASAIPTFFFRKRLALDALRRAVCWRCCCMTLLGKSMSD